MKKDNTKNESKNHTSRFGWVDEIASLIDKHGYWKLISTCIMFVFMSFIAYVAINPTVYFEKYQEFENNRHIESFNQRLKVSPLIDGYLDQFINEVGGMRAFVIEMHNGKSNAAGLSFNYGSMTYEALAEDAMSIKEDYVDFTLDKYKTPLYIYKNGFLEGTIDEIRNVDRKLALKLEYSECAYSAAIIIHGKKSEIGFLGVSFRDKNVDKVAVQNALRKYAAKIGPLLDGELNE